MKRGMKLISLAPTQTEIVAALGMTGNLAGVTEDCDYPAEIKHIPRFGSWYSPAVGAIIKAEPDLVLTFGSHQEEIGRVLEDAGIRVYHSEPPTIAGSLESFRQIADLVGRQEHCESMIALLEERLLRIRRAIEDDTRPQKPSVFRIMNWDPLIAPGPGAFQHDVIEFAGGSNTTGDGLAPYFVCDPGEIRRRNPDIIFFCEPAIRTFLESDPYWQKVNAVKQGRIYVWDCGLTCRSGPRIVDMTEELSRVVLER
jgi:iron complex transport system substrate-binding protein